MRRAGLVGPLMTSWFGVTNLTDEERKELPWVTRRLDHRTAEEMLDEDLRLIGAVDEDSNPMINSAIKLKFFPNQDQRLNFDQFVGAHRGVYTMA